MFHPSHRIKCPQLTSQSQCKHSLSFHSPHAHSCTCFLRGYEVNGHPLIHTIINLKRRLIWAVLTFTNKNSQTNLIALFFCVLYFCLSIKDISLKIYFEVLAIRNLECDLI